MQAVYVGKNGSMGLVTGNTYDITLQAGRKNVWVRWKDEENDEWKSCPYSSLEALHRNWRSPNAQ